MTIKFPECPKHPATTQGVPSMSGIVDTTFELRPAGLFKVHRVSLRCNTHGCAEPTRPGPTYAERVATHEADREEAQRRLLDAIHGGNAAVLSGRIGWCPDCREGVIDVFVSARDPFAAGSRASVLQFGSNPHCRGMCAAAQWEEV